MHEPGCKVEAHASRGAMRPQFKAAIPIVDAQQFASNQRLTTHHDRSLGREEHHSHGMGRMGDWKGVGMHYIDEYEIERRQPSGSCLDSLGDLGYSPFNDRTQAFRHQLI